MGVVVYIAREVRGKEASRSNYMTIGQKSRKIMNQTVNIVMKLYLSELRYSGFVT